MPKEIIFVDTTDSVPEEYYPVPAVANLPSWFTKLEPYHSYSTVADGLLKRQGQSTAKRCLPLFDAMSAGYLILSVADIYVFENEDGTKLYEWPSDSGTRIEFHDRGQLSTYSVPESYHYVPKFVNPWALITPSNYSVLILPPMNRDDCPIEIFSGIIDTDEFNAAGSFPFLFKDKDFTGLIPAGTPIAQVIPFRRESFKMFIGDDEARNKSIRSKNKLASKFSNAYRKLMHSKKSFR